MTGVPSGLLLRTARASDAPAIARIMRASLLSHDWMPMVHTPEEDLAFIAGKVLPEQKVTVAEMETVLGFIALREDWVEHLYLDPAWTGRGIGSALLAAATAGMPVVRLHCFQANTGGRRFYERQGFRAASFGDGSTNEERLPDILYVRST